MQWINLIFCSADGSWLIKFPKANSGPEDAGEGEGEFKRILNNQYVIFDYHAKLSAGKGAAHGIFAWDKKSKIYRYWWFEDSGEFMEAACDFINENTLYLNWHKSVLIQTFHEAEKGKVFLEMRYPSDKNNYQIILEVVLTRIRT
jgi:hypothetical protein